jgi:hypothetical protein
MVLTDADVNMPRAARELLAEQDEVLRRGWRPDAPEYARYAAEMVQAVRDRRLPVPR